MRRPHVSRKIRATSRNGGLQPSTRPARTNRHVTDCVKQAIRFSERRLCKEEIDRSADRLLDIYICRPNAVDAREVEFLGEQRGELRGLFPFGYGFLRLRQIAKQYPLIMRRVTVRAMLAFIFPVVGQVDEWAGSKRGNG